MPPVPPRRGLPAAAEVNPFADMTPQQAASPQQFGTPGTSTPGSVAAPAEANPFADMVATPAQVATPPVASGTATPANGFPAMAEVNPFAAATEVQCIKSPPGNAVANPFADEPVPSEAVVIISQTSTAPEVTPRAKAAVLEMVGGLETEMERMDVAKTPDVPTKEDPESSETESESESESTKESVKEGPKVTQAPVTEKGLPTKADDESENNEKEAVCESKPAENEESSDSDDSASTVFSEMSPRTALKRHLQDRKDFFF